MFKPPILLLAVATVLSATAAADDPVFTRMFDGETLQNWEGDPQRWSVQDGSIVGQTTADKPVESNTFLIWKKGEFADFEFRCKVRFEGNNSGVQYRSKPVDSGAFALSGYQADLHPKAEYFGMLYGEKTGRGIIAQRGQKVVVPKDGKPVAQKAFSLDKQLTDREWNELRVIAVGNRLIHQVNGITTVDVTDNHVDASKTGKIGLQLHRGPAMKVEFRNLLIRKLDPTSGAAVLEEVTAVAENSNDQQAETTKEPATSVSRNWLTSKPEAEWIWTQQSTSGQKLWMRTGFEAAGKIKSAQLYATCDNQFELWINGKSVATSKQWERAIEKSVAKNISSGKNVIAVLGKNDGGVAAFVMKLEVTLDNGKKIIVTSNRDWKVNSNEVKGWTSVDFDDSAWEKPVSRGKLGVSPWGVPNHSAARTNSASAGDRLAPHRITVPEGFVVDRIHEVTQDQGSWVSLTVDPQGRFYASDQGGKGLYRLTVRSGKAPLVEKVSVGNLSSLSGAQGMSWAFDSLWVHRNGGNLYRLTDSDGDDKLDTIETIPGTTGGGEHGNHAVIPTEDGKRLYLVGGNHAPLAEHERSRVPSWEEDLLLPRMWDARGHARGKMAPGGWITELDPETHKQTVRTIGFRNQYDVALNRDGELFTYDADMEWDLGLPWYRPTRICMAVSGADFGWRSGSGKWPAYYEDSLPPVVDIGPGSPTGFVSGAGTKFPTRYQDALFALDWTFGTIYAIHLQAEGAGYTGEAEPFATGQPLPVTDAIVGHDGALYFTVGGRGAKSGLFRIRYVGDESRTEPTGSDPKAQAAREHRRQLEAFHGVEDKAAVDAAWPVLSSPDRYLRHAARIAIESQPLDSWADRVASERDPQTRITASVAYARSASEDRRADLLQILNATPTADLTSGQLLGLLRGYALCFTRLGSPTPEQRSAVISKLNPLLPHANDDVNTELIRVLTSLRAKQMIPKAMSLITNRKPPEIEDWSKLASRNAGYGSRINALMEKHPPTRELNYAFMMRNLRDGWTIEQRRTYFEFLNEAAGAAGGNSYGGYLTRIRDAALGSCSDEERVALKDITGENYNPVPDFEIVKPVGPGQAWTVDTAMAGLRGKANFERGRSLFFSVKCASCHRLRGLGGNIGPDLTSVRNKFDERYVIEAIVHPSKHISDQYGSSIVLDEDGNTHTGLVVEQEDGSVLIYSNDPDAEPIRLQKSQIEEVQQSKTSQMPEKLLDTMNAAEIRDLVNYLMSAGDKTDRRFGK